MLGRPPLIYRLFGATAVGAALFGVADSVYQTSELLRPTTNENASHHRQALLRDLALLAVTLPSLALFRASSPLARAMRQAERRVPALKNELPERDSDLIHVIALPSREDIRRVRDLEDAYFDFHLDWWAFPEKFGSSFEDAEEGHAQVRSALAHWESWREANDEIGETEALMAVARLKAKLGVYLTMAGRVSDGEMYERAASIQVLVVGQQLEALNRNLESAAAKGGGSPISPRIRDLRVKAEEAIREWSLLPVVHPDPGSALHKLEGERRKAEALSEKDRSAEAAETLIRYSLAARQYACAIRYRGDQEGYRRFLLEGVTPMKRARAILRSLEDGEI